MTTHRPTRLTPSVLKTLAPGQWRSENLGYGKGSLQVRATTTGIRFYYRRAGDRHRVPLGPGSGREAISLDQARNRSWSLAASDVRGERSNQSLGALLTGYCKRLDQRGSKSGSKVLAMFRRHIESPWPALWLRQASAIQAEDLITVMEPLVEREKLPTARKLRAALHAAYEVALRSPCCAQSSEFRCFRIVANPVSRVRPVAGGPLLPDRVLSGSELKALWDFLSEMRCVRGPVLRFYLLTGAQRMEQLLRATREDLVEEGLILWDRKGQRQRPRRHLVPLIAPARLALMAMGGSGRWIVSIDGGRSRLHPSTIWRYVANVSEGLVADGLVKAPFSPADLRRTVETRLAGLGFSSAVRAQLQSHGLAGVQARHYDRHDYLNEKLEALARFHALISGAS